MTASRPTRRCPVEPLTSTGPVRAAGAAAHTGHDAGRTLRLALLAWGAGHIALGLRRGWLLLVLQPLALGVVAVLTVLLIDGTRWLIVFVPLVALFLVWIGQALDAYHRALRSGHAPGGEWTIVAILPVMIGVLTVFWLVGGRHGSPAATLQAYADAWISDRPEMAGQLFVSERAPDQMLRQWQGERSAVVDRITRARAIHGAESGLNPERPFDSLRFREVRSSSGRVAMIAEIVRNQRVETTLLGFVPTAGQETVVVEHALTVWLTLQPQPVPGWLEPLPLDSFAWKIESIEQSPLP